MKPNIIVWLMGGSGVVLLYSAVKNVNPGSLITSYFTGKKVTPLVDMDTGTKVNPNNGLVDPKSRGSSGPLLEPNNPNNLFPKEKPGDGKFTPTSSRQYVAGDGQIHNYPAGYVAPSGYQNA